MNIKILVIKNFQPQTNHMLTRPIIDIICNYSNLLTKKVQTYNGFQKSQSYWDINNINNNKIITISNWDTIEDWNNWFNSNDRYNINKANKHISIY